MPNSTQELEETLLSRETLYEGHVTFHSDTVKLPSGRSASRDVVEHGGAVGVVVTEADGRLLLVRQWRHAVGRAMWEICAGGMEPDEDPQDCAKRELAEETGFHAASWTSLGAFALAPGYSTESMHLFHATGLQPGPSNPDEDETLQVAFFEIAAVRRLIESGDVDMKTIGGLALAGVDVHG